MACADRQNLELAAPASRRGVSVEVLAPEALERAVDYGDWSLREVETRHVGAWPTGVACSASVSVAASRVTPMAVSATWFL